MFFFPQAYKGFLSIKIQVFFILRVGLGSSYMFLGVGFRLWKQNKKKLSLQLQLSTCF
jgi:hypothetical protein